MSNYALIKNGVVENIVVWDGNGDLFSDYQVVELSDDTMAALGWSYDGKSFIAPAEPEKSHDELVDEAEQQKSALLAEAQSTISIWQTELHLGRISDEDKASLIAGINYIKALQATGTSTAPDIEWPEPPVD